MEVTESSEVAMEAEMDSSYVVKPPDASSALIEGLDKPLSVPRQGDDQPGERRIVKVNLSGAKRIPGNMVPRKEPEVPAQVAMARQLLTTLGDYTQMGPDDVLTENIEALAQAMAESGDLSTFGEGIADLFVQCFSQLSAQTPVYAALLSQLLGAGQEAFLSLVVARLESAALQALDRDEVVTAKLLLRALACLAAAGVVSTTGDFGLL
eukprot:gene43115-52694_t